MASGKTYVGHELSRLTGKTMLDTDALIEETSGQKISDIFQTQGELCFRDLETDVTRSLSGYKDTIISTGGGIILRQENRELLKEAGLVFLLWSTPEKTLERVQDDNSRPLLNVTNKLQKIRKMLSDRESFYRGTADFIMDSDNNSIEELASKILKLV
jgi:shikimate kinase